MKTIQLTQGQVTMVDDADFEAVSQFKWYALKSRRGFYAVRNIRKPDGKKTTQYLHRFLLPGVPEVDHKDGNRLNNQRGKNLRPATVLQNRQGFRQKRLGATSRFRGVCWDRRKLKWMARIDVSGKPKFLGYFDFEKDAAEAYNDAAKKYFRDFASLNF